MFWSLPNQTFWKRCFDLAIERFETLLEEDVAWTDDDVLWASGPDVVTTIYNEEFEFDPTVKVYNAATSCKYLTHINNGSWRNNMDSTF
jgi:hypothetical protein